MAVIRLKRPDCFQIKPVEYSLVYRRHPSLLPMLDVCCDTYLSVPSGQLLAAHTILFKTHHSSFWHFDFLDPSLHASRVEEQLVFNLMCEKKGIQRSISCRCSSPRLIFVYNTLRRAPWDIELRGCNLLVPVEQTGNCRF